MKSNHQRYPNILQTVSLFDSTEESLTSGGGGGNKAIGCYRRKVRAYMACANNPSNAIDSIWWNHVDGKLIKGPKPPHSPHVWLTKNGRSMSRTFGMIVDPLHALSAMLGCYACFPNANQVNLGCTFPLLQLACSCWLDFTHGITHKEYTMPIWCAPSYYCYLLNVRT